MDLSTIIGEALTAVEFVQDYLQLRFDQAFFTLFVWPEVADADGIAVAFGQPGYRDALCSVIGENVTDAQFEEGQSLTLEFENSTVLALSLREEDIDAPEVGSFTGASGEVIEF